MNVLFKFNTLERSHFHKFVVRFKLHGIKISINFAYKKWSGVFLYHTIKKMNIYFSIGIAGISITSLN